MKISLSALFNFGSWSLFGATQIFSNNNGSGDGKFSTASNWQGGSLPLAGDDLQFNADCVYDLVTAVDTTISIIV